jgi:hypothetical protein
MKQKLSHNYQKEVLAYRAKELRARLEILSTRHRIAVLKTKLADLDQKLKERWLNSKKAVEIRNTLKSVYKVHKDLMDNVKTLGSEVVEANNRKKGEEGYDAQTFNNVMNKLIVPLSKSVEGLASRIGGQGAADPMLSVWGDTPAQISTKGATYLPSVTIEEAVDNVGTLSKKVEKAFRTLETMVKLLENITRNEAPKLLKPAKDEINTLQSNTSKDVYEPEVDQLLSLTEKLVKNKKPLVNLVS